MENIVAFDYLDNLDKTNITNSLEEIFSKADFSSLFKPKMKVLLKVSLPGNFSPDLAKTTHPNVVNGLVNVLTKLGVDCIIADSPYKAYTQTNLDNVYIDTGMLEVANSSKCKLNRNLKTHIFKFNSGLELKSVEMLDIINEVDAIINVGKLRIDDKLGYFGAMQNLFGFIPGNKKELILTRFEKLKNFNNYLLDIYEILKKKLILNVLDGIIAEESGETQHLLGCLAVSNNVFSLDNFIMSTIGINEKNNYIEIAEKRNLFNPNSYKKIIGDKTKLNIDNFKINQIDNETILNAPNKKLGCGKNMKRPQIELKTCKGCGVCSKICPNGAISMEFDNNNELYAKIDYNKCIYCFKCVTGCPYKVVKFKTPCKYRQIEKSIAKQNEIVEE